MSFRDRVAYGLVYDAVANDSAIRRETSERWNDLAKYSLARRLDDVQLIEVAGDIERLRRLYQLMRGNFAYPHQFAARIGVGAKPQSELPPRKVMQPALAAFCKPAVSQ